MPWFAHHDIILAIMRERYALAAVARFVEKNACAAQFSSPQQTEVLGNYIAEQIAIEYDSRFCLTGVVRTRFCYDCSAIPLIFKQHYECYSYRILMETFSAAHRKHTAVLCESDSTIP